MRARGIDPGDTIGWCDVERESAGVYRFVGCGSIEATKQERGLVLLLQPGVDLYAVETPEEMHPSDIAGQITAVMSGKLKPGAAAARMVQTVRNLLETRALAERIACSLVGAGARVVEPTAAEVRHALGVRLGAQRGRGPRLTVDQQLAHIIPLAVRGWPPRSNPHVRDAAAAALWALQQAEVEEAVGRAVAPA